MPNAKISSDGKTFTLTFSIPKDDVVNALKAQHELYQLTTYDFPGHYYQLIETRTKYLFKVTTRYPEEENLKKLLFRLNLKYDRVKFR